MRRPRPNPRPAAEGPLRTLEIASFGAQGDGVAATAEHVALTLPGEEIEATVVSGRGDLVRVLRASPDRIDAACPHFGACGGCALQHWAAEPYLAWKIAQVRLALERVGLSSEFVTPYAAQPGERRRLALHARRDARGVVRLGFKTRRSWNLVDIAACPVAAPGLVAVFPALRRLAGAFLEHPTSAPTLHVTLTETGIDVDVTGVERKSGGLSRDAHLRAADLAAEAGFARVTLAGEMVYGARPPRVSFGRASVDLPPGGFLQASAGAEAAMAAMAVQALAGAARVADLYCGAGAFTFRLAETAAVLAVDSAAPAVRALAEGAAQTAGLKAVVAEVRDLGRRPVLASEFKKIDAVLFDPPRAGALEQAGEIARSGLGRVVGVSCNPVTFARDAAVLVEAGFTLERVMPVDQFLWSPHIELVGVFTR